MSQSYLLPEDDGLAMRESNDYAKDKLRILKGYIYRFTTSMRVQSWRALNYVDLLAGPGKNIFFPSKEIMLGSPLIGLTTKYPFTNYRFCELDEENCKALETRVRESELRDRTKVICGDCNIVVDEVVDEIQKLDRQYVVGRWPSLNLAFIDPSGLEVHWETISKLGQINRMDLIINFSTSGFTRNALQMMDQEEATRLDEFFGTVEWRQIYSEVADKNITRQRRAILDFYKKRLATLGYIFNFDRNIDPDEKVFRNRKGVQVYSLMFASKHELGIQFWQGAIKEVSQPRLL